MEHQNTPEIRLNPADARPESERTLSRRKVVDLAAKAGTAAFLLGTLGAVGCQSTAQKRVDKVGGSLGDPIPNDPVARTSSPRPIATSPSSPSYSSSDSLSSIPPFVIARSKWTSSGPKRWLADPMGTISRITIHHDAIMPVPGNSYAESLRRMQLIRTGHLNNGWADIGYHFAIDPSGRIWQARPLELQGAHVKDHNPGNLGIVVFGNYEQMRPTQASLTAIDRMVAYAMDRFNVPVSRVHTHQELRPTACPGRNLQSQMELTRSRGGRLAQLVDNKSLMNV